MNKKLSVKTDDRYLRLMEWWPKEGQVRCSRCCLDKDSEDCQALCGLCKPMIGEKTLTGLETGGFFVESKPISRPNGRFEKSNRDFKKRHRGGKGRFHGNRPDNGERPPRISDTIPHRETRW